MGAGKARGQTTSEYVGVLVLVAAIVGVFFALGLSDRVTDAAEQAICRIFDGDDEGCGDGDESEPDDPDDERSPREIAEAGDYVAIGDSYSSGEGADDYDPDTDTDDNRCHRSENAYPEQIAAEFDFEGDVRIVTCSGARTHNAGEDGQHNEDPQIEAIDDDTSLVTIGIGGNDAEWTEVIQNCLVSVLGAGCMDTDYARDKMETAAENVVELYEEIREAAPDDARIAAIGYPRFFPEDPEGTYRYCVGPEILGECSVAEVSIDPEQQEWLNQMVGEFNDLLAEKAEDAGIEFVNMYDAFSGHELTSDDPYFNGLRLNGGLEWPPVEAHPDSFHPNAAGQRRMGELVAEQIEDPS